jgi:hypothetical protein
MFGFFPLPLSSPDRGSEVGGPRGGGRGGGRARVSTRGGRRGTQVGSGSPFGLRIDLPPFLLLLLLSHLDVSLLPPFSLLLLSLLRILRSFLHLDLDFRFLGAPFFLLLQLLWGFLALGGGEGGGRRRVGAGGGRR